jgi:glutamine synthetase
MSMPRNARDAAEVLAEIESSGAPRAKVGGFDIDGILRGKSISTAKLRSALETGFGFCDVIFGWDAGDALYDNARFTGWHTGYPDALARIEPDTYRRVPWEEEVPFFLCDFYAKDGAPLPVSPRQALRRVIARAESLGYEPVMACEFEFFLFRETPQSLREKGWRGLTPLSPGMFGYSVYRASANAPLVSDLVRWLRAFDCEIEGIHTETGPGVYEVALACDGALRAADKAQLFKTAVKEIAARHGLVACFMAKWNSDLPGCSGHIHQSLWKGDENAFAGAGGAPSETLERYAAGQLATMREFLPFYLPTVNSYKRTVPGTWAPVSATWGVENRTTALRVIPGLSTKQTRIETRITGADVNAYVACAASLAAGLHGIERGLALGPECRGNAYETRDPAAALPRSLEAALPHLERSEVAREYLGEAFVEHYLATREWEVRQAQKAVTDWELARYFEVI